MPNKTETVEILVSTYRALTPFWQKVEGNEEDAKLMALKEALSLRYDPNSETGDRLDPDGIESAKIQILKDIYGNKWQKHIKKGGRIHV